jgi:hypothetical protein
VRGITLPQTIEAKQNHRDIVGGARGLRRLHQRFRSFFQRASRPQNCRNAIMIKLSVKTIARKQNQLL